LRSRRGTTFIPSPNSTLRRDEPDPIRQEFGAVWNAYPMRDDDERTELSGADLSEAAQLDETIFGNTRLVDARGLDACTHDGPSTLDFRTLERYGMLPLVCLRGCGLSERLIEFLPSLLNRPIEFYSCFISYGHADKSFARRLHDQLQGRGIRCWLDDHQVPGDDIHEQVQRGIKLWDKVLGVLLEGLAHELVGGQ